MQTLPGTKVKIPVAKLFAFITKFVGMTKNGISQEEAHEILGDFLELLSVVLTGNLSE